MGNIQESFCAICCGAQSQDEITIDTEIRNASANNIDETSVWYIGINEENQCGVVLSDDNYKADRLTLCRWSKTKNVTSINTFKYSTIFTIDTAQNNQVSEYWSAGHNWLGECALGHFEDITSITQIMGMTNVGKICSSICATNVLWIKNDGELYMNGCNQSGECGSDPNYPNNRISKPRLVEFVDGNHSNVVVGAASDYCSIIALNDGSVWSSGCGENGENGHGGNPKKITKFTQIVALKSYKVIAVSMGGSFSFFVTDSGKVFSCGENQMGQLGVGYRDGWDDFDPDDSIHRLPTLINYFEEKNIIIVNVECGGFHSIALDQNGLIYGWGQNSMGSLGIGYTSHKATPVLIQKLVNHKVLKINCGTYHSGCITVGNNAFLWGSNHHNECCVENEMNEIWEPHCINQYVMNMTNSQKIINIELSDRTTIIHVAK